jgi:hypothetical protein
LLYDAIARTSQAHIKNFNPQGLSILILAYAKLNHNSPELFDAIAKAAQACIRDFNPQDLSNTAWAFATLKHKAPLLFDVIARTSQARIGSFNPQDLSNLILKVEQLTESRYGLDAVIVYRGNEKIGMEVDEPSHFFEGQSQSPKNGATVF